MTSWLPIESCTLPTAEQPLRVAEFDALFAETLASVERHGPARVRLVLHGNHVLDRVRDLVARESSCCSFFTFDVTPLDSGVALTVEVPQIAVLAGLTARADSTLT